MKYKKSKENALVVFQDKKIRRIWHNEKWFFSIIDIIAVLTDNGFQGARNHWKVLKHRMKNEGNETVTNCNQLKLPASDGKLRLTDVADTEQLLRLIQSIPSKKAEPFKRWLAKVGYERIEETQDPELAFDRAMQTYLQKGYSKEWINQRLKTIEVRKELTDEWNRVGIDKQPDYAILTNEITKAWSGKTVKEYKVLKGLRKENLRDNMTNLELVLNMLAEVSTKELSVKQNPDTFQESKKIAKKGGNVAKAAKDNIEKQLGESVIARKNARAIYGKRTNELK
jgi:prophage antirepressor-like protein